MQFNQTNNNKGDVNNAISEKGSVVQSIGSQNRVQFSHPKEKIWLALWKKGKAVWKMLFG